MNENDFLKYAKEGNTIEALSEYHEICTDLLLKATKIKMKLNCEYHTEEEIREIFAELTSSEVNETLSIVPPFHTDCGKNIVIGENVFINSNCTMQDQGGIYIGDDVLIGHNTCLLTLNHDPDPEKRGNLHPSPIHIEDKVWLGSNVTVLPGVSLGDNVIVGANAVVTHSFPANTVIAGCPAKIIKTLN